MGPNNFYDVEDESSAESTKKSDNFDPTPVGYLEDDNFYWIVSSIPVSSNTTEEDKG